MTFLSSDYLDFEQTAHETLFKGCVHVWETLSNIGDYLKKNLKAEVHAKLAGKPFIGEQVYVGKGTVIEPGVCIQGPAWIGENCLLRQGAYIRENVIVGDHCVLGNSCEFKNCVIFNDCEIPHFTYVGDSILGHKVHLGAGVVLSNLKLNRTSVQIRCENCLIDTGLKKFGAIIGDRSEIGANAVLNPGSVIGRDCLVYPLISWVGVLPAQSIVKGDTQYRILPRRGV
ncbi:MAG: DapH/DapD/GlmU-related protein [Verrucomicrobiota bacterium]